MARATSFLWIEWDRLEEELAPHARGVGVALAAFGVGKGSAKMADEDVRKIEVTYPTAFASAAKAGGARVLAMMTAVDAKPQSSVKYIRNIGDKEKKSEALHFRVRELRDLAPRHDPLGFDFLGLYRPAVILGNSNTLGLILPLFHWAMPSRYGCVHREVLEQPDALLLAPGHQPLVDYVLLFRDCRGGEPTRFGVCEEFCDGLPDRRHVRLNDAKRAGSFPLTNQI
jgi:hypothetical protein